MKSESPDSGRQNGKVPQIENTFDEAFDAPFLSDTDVLLDVALAGAEPSSPGQLLRVVLRWADFGGQGLHCLALHRQTCAYLLKTKGRTSSLGCCKIVLMSAEVGSVQANAGARAAD